MNQSNPQQLFDAFCITMWNYKGFKVNPVPDSGYECWDNDGMHDPPRLGRRYSQVLARV